MPLFEYHSPDTIDEVLALLAEHGDEAKVLAGGQSLIPLLAMRLARPTAGRRHQSAWPGCRRSTRVATAIAFGAHGA